MAQTATLRRYEIAISDSDRNVYESVLWRVAQHPSETHRYLAARIVARCLEHAEGVDFSKGLGSDDEPALWQKDLRGDLHAWIEVGAPSTERLHRASKACPRIVIYAYKQADKLLKDAVAFKAHKVETWTVVELDPAFLDEIEAHTEKVNKWDLSISGGAIYLNIGPKLIESSLVTHTTASLGL